MFMLLEAGFGGRPMKRIQIILIIICILLICRTAINQTVSKTNDSTISFCDLMRDADSNVGKTLTVKGTFRHGMYVAQFYCSDCLEAGKGVAVGVVKEADRCEGFDKTLSGIAGRTSNVIFTGQLRPRGSYGHLGEFSYSFKVSCIDSATVIYEMGVLPDALPKEIREKTHCR